MNNEKDIDNDRSANVVYVYKIRNKETGEWSSGVNTYWSKSFLHTTIYDSPAPAKAVLTKIKKEMEWSKKYYPATGPQRYEEFLEKAEIVMVKLTAEVQNL